MSVFKGLKMKVVCENYNNSNMYQPIQTLKWREEHCLFYETCWCYRTSTLSFLATDFSRDSVVRLAPRYRLDGPGFESPWGFPHPFRPDPKPTHLTDKMEPILYPRDKAAGAWR